MPTQVAIDEIIERIEALEASRFVPDGEWMRPSDAADAVPWDDLTEEQQYGVLVSEFLWPGFDVSQIVDVARRVVEGESSEFWMDGIEASDQAEHIARELHSMCDEEASIKLLEKGVDYSDRPYGVVDVEKPEGRDSYEVWHARDLFAAGAIGRVMGMPPQEFPDDYEKVADVLARDLDQVFALTNHTDTSWQDNPGVSTNVAEARSTSDGDVIVDPEGRPHRVEPTGFEQLVPRSSYDRMLSEAAEAGKHRTKDASKGIDR